MSLKVVTPGQNTGFDAVGTADFKAGMIGARTTTGAIVLAGSEAAAAGTGPMNKPVGVLGDDRITASFVTTTQVQEEIVSVANVPVALAHNAITTGSVYVTLKSNVSTLLVGPGVQNGPGPGSNDYNVDVVNGTITVWDNGNTTVADGTAVLVTYTFSLNDAFEQDFFGVNFKGALDDTAGSQKATVWKGYGEYETDQFNTQVAYAIGDKLRVTHSSHALGAGLLTNEAAGGTVVEAVCARVTKVPTAANPFLGFEFDPNLTVL